MTSTMNDLATLGLRFRRAVPIDVDLVPRLLLHYTVRSASRRGFIIVMDGWLVRLTDESGPWTAELLHVDPTVGLDPQHEHSIAPVVGDEHILTCVTCGSEW